MGTRATPVGVDLHVDLPAGGRGVRSALMEALREAVRDGRLAPGVRLPSSRSLAVDLGVARNTVADAYSELVAEGWLTARHGSGTQVARRAAMRAPVPLTPGPPNTGRPVHDLVPGRPDVSSFPRAAWLRSARRALSSAPDEAFGYGGPLGRIELRHALADYLGRARGVRTDPARIVVCAGVMHGLELLAAVLAARRVRSVAVESHSLYRHRQLLARRGLRVGSLQVDDAGARTDTLSERRLGAVLLTPAHQFPTGIALHPDRRAAAIDWARATGGLVIEDDYDGEFRYDRQPVGALQGLDPEQVVYLGTASKALSPGLRLGWMVLPAHLVAEVERAKDGTDNMNSATDQLILADLLACGAYDRHVRERRQAYRRRRDQLVETLAARVPEVRVRGLSAGLHALVELPAGTEEAVRRSAAWHGLAVEGLDRFRHPDAPARPDALVVGYATASPSAWAGALDALCRVLG